MFYRVAHTFGQKWACMLVYPDQEIGNPSGAVARGRDDGIAARRNVIDAAVPYFSGF